MRNRACQIHDPLVYSDYSNFNRGISFADIYAYLGTVKASAAAKDIPLLKFE